jgi:hypothetical protein
MPAMASATPASANAPPAAPAWMRSPNASRPISRLVMASNAIWAATAVPSVPARSDACESAMLA